jgi:hypothetical protein
MYKYMGLIALVLLLVTTDPSAAVTVSNVGALQTAVDNANRGGR